MRRLKTMDISILRVCKYIATILDSMMEEGKILDEAYKIELKDNNK